MASTSPYMSFMISTSPYMSFMIFRNFLHLLGLGCFSDEDPGTVEYR